MPIEVIERNLDGMAAVKLNVFHWHLSDDQGFRAESKLFPKLQKWVGRPLLYAGADARSGRLRARPRHPRGSGVRHARPQHELVRRISRTGQRARALSDRAPLGSFRPGARPHPRRDLQVPRRLHRRDGGLFPDPFFHIGGDEVNGKEWNANPRDAGFHAGARPEDTLGDLQTYFNQRLQKILRKHGKNMVGWDEILRPDLPKDIVIQSWRGAIRSPAIAATQGYRGILSAGYYLDHVWPAAYHYAVDPLARPAAKLTPEQAKAHSGRRSLHVVGASVDAETIDSRIWPRTAAIAERFWSPADVRDVDSMYERLAVTSRWLEWRGLTHNSYYEPMLRRITGSDDISALRMLADVVEPVKDYTREETAPETPTSLVPLDRLIDAAHPESILARNFSEMVDALIAGRADTATKQTVRNLLLRWQDNQGKLEALESQSFLWKEVAPLSQSLSALATIGLQALDYIDQAEQPPDSWKTEQLTILENAQQQKAQLLLMVVAPIQKLVETAAGQRTAEFKK